MLPTDSIDRLKGVGASTINKLSKLKINNITDVINHYPKRYIDFSKLDKIIDLSPGNVTIRIKLSTPKTRYVRRGMNITESLAYDDTSKVKVLWFNQPYRAKGIKVGEEYFLSGEYKLNGNNFSFINPSLELVSDFPVNTARILPVYKLTEGVNASLIRKLVKESLLKTKLEDIFSKDFINEFNLISQKDAYMKLHFPDNPSDVVLARRRFSFEEGFKLMLASIMNKEEIALTDSHKIKFNLELAKKFVDSLPFKLTDDQRIAVWQIYKDLDKKHPMNRLVEGDVGSGKTIVAAMSALMPLSEGKQVALMVPTEILAKQHYKTFLKIYEPLGLTKEIALITSSTSKKDKEQIVKDIAEKKKLMIIGTHSLIEDYLKPDELALVIIDEQHRFGVEQRKRLVKKAKYQPHLLSLSATPIPRSLALTLFRDLDLSKIKAAPNKEKSITTEIYSRSEYTRNLPGITKILESGQQMFVVCPSIDSEKTKSVTEIYEEIVRDYPKYKVAKLHGKMKQDEKDKIMLNFLEKKTDILVSTTVIEVGVDVPNANVMLIFSPNSFGLAQLHQLRGRVGRGQHPGFCYLIVEDNEQVTRRLSAIESYSDGFKLSEIDLDLRGPGQVYGIFQHGELDLNFFNFSDMELIREIEQAVALFIDKGYNIEEFPLLFKEVNELRKITNLD